MKRLDYIYIYNEEKEWKKREGKEKRRKRRSEKNSQVLIEIMVNFSSKDTFFSCEFSPFAIREKNRGSVGLETGNRFGFACLSNSIHGLKITNKIRVKGERIR